MTSANRIIRWSTAAVVVGVAAVAAVGLYEHAYALAHAHVETWWHGRRPIARDLCVNSARSSRSPTGPHCASARRPVFLPGSLRRGLGWAS